MGVITLFSFSLLCLCSHALAASPSPGSSNATADELALLSFKSMLSQGPSGLLASWNISGHYCSWPGVVCGRRHPDRVVALLMDSLDLSGHISPFLGNLSFLKKLNLGNNQLVGQIPPELGHLSKLQVLNLSTNSLQGGIPVALGGCTKMTTLDLSFNNFQGEIPRSLAGLPSIKFLVLITSKVRSLDRWQGLPSIKFLAGTTLRYLMLGINMLSGAIPSSLGMLSNLFWLGVGFNNLTGAIPASIWNISSLATLSVQFNMLSGMIPPNAFHALPHLEGLGIDHNQFHGHFPGASLANASDMSKLQIGSNFFSGTVPPEVGNLRNLKWLQLAYTMLEAKEPKDWECITSLTNCSMVKGLYLSYCKFGGVLPDSLSNLSTSLIYLTLDGNTISGSIPKDIGNLVNLQALDLGSNYFTGALPSSLGRLKNLHHLNASKNEISGSIPTTLGNLTEINKLYLDGNSFSGRIPNSLGNLTELLDLRLASNNITGPIPSGLFNITTLSISLDLSHNILEGSIPQEIGESKNLVEFHAESNKLTGEIPTTLGECQLLQSLYLQDNFLIGIPSPLSQLRGLQALDLSSNNLSGQIPKFLGELSMLYHLNLSFNSLDGEVTNVGVFANATAVSMQGNVKLCGGITDLHLPPCSLELSKKKNRFPVIPVVISLIATLAILPLLYKLLTCHKKSKTKIPSTTSMQGHPLISYSQLVNATDGFSSTNLLGSGSFGTVYKGELDSQAGESTYLVAVKVLKLQTPGALKSFIAECEALRNLRHRNLVKIITACSSIDTRGNDFKALVFDFMPNGSLEGWLHPDTNEQTDHKYLNLLERIRILLDVANALDYLHCQGPAPVVHCDLKPSNVLLDAEMIAHVGDFGLAKILVETSSVLQQPSSSMGFRGTIGYAPPEYGAGNMVSTHGDIYSYGILVLETVTGKRPTDSGFGQGLSLREYVGRGLHDRVLDVVDMRLSLDPENGLHTANDSSYKIKIDCLVSLFRLGMSCSQELPSSRMKTGDIIKELQAIKECDDGRYACHTPLLR